MRFYVTALASAGCAQVPTPAAISPGALRSHVSFLSSDLLEGQFCGAGLEPAGDDGYFQSAHWQYAKGRALNAAP
ncbi:hypothetical protein [Massilia sp. H6]|uniref:hypothetical protein n=1 Tax=Massilia sp. H6 TaxID=2970464 RepID=UPI00216751C5|nr:hypothetical protein [Massilia sp. H6]UVW29442.1 hypothetical protein NRS07_04740 [Massilia sp. H6]